MTSILLFNTTVAINSQTRDEQLVSTSECWRYNSNELMALAPAYDKNNLYLAERGGRISAISVQTGARIWSTELGGEVRSNLAVLGSTVYVAVAPIADGKTIGGVTLHTLSSLTGLPSFDIPIPSTSEIRLVTAANELLVLTNDGHVSVYDGVSQRIAWQRKFSTPATQTLVWNGKLLVANSDLNIRVVSLATGNDLAIIPIESPVSALSVIENDIVWGDDRGEIIRYDLDRNSVYWRIKNGARISGLVTTDEGVVAASLDNFTYLISPYYGRVRWKKRLPGRIDSLVGYGKDLIVLHAIGESSVTLLNSENGKPVRQVSIGNASLTVPPMVVDGRLVFLTNKLVMAQRAGPCTIK